MEQLFFKQYMELSCSFRKFSLFNDLSKMVTEESRDFYINKANSLTGYHFSPIMATDYMKFKRLGNREDCEHIYFEKRNMLNVFFIAELLENKGRFLDDIINGIFSICEESGWQLPAHNSYIRDTPQEILPDNSRPVMDLFACESGAQLAIIYHFLKSALDKISPFICSRIEYELNKRIIMPYLNEHFWWMGNGDEPMCNWTSWCTQNTLICASCLPLPKDSYEKVIRKVCESMDFFLKDYGEDGCCEEGAQYYHHAGLCLFLTTKILNNISDNSFTKIWDNEKIKNIAEYICNIHAQGDYYFNFADCSPIAGKAGAEEYLFGKEIKSGILISFAAKDFSSDSKRLLPVEESDTSAIRRILTLYYEQEILDYANSHPKVLVPGNIWYESVGVFIARSGETTLAVKSGDNNDSHNHNDTGSIILYHDAKPILIDVGVSTYTAKTFSDKRYEIWTMQSSYHNLPTIAGFDELNGENYKASNVKTDMSNKALIEMELKNCYPNDCGLKSYVRKVSLTKALGCLDAPNKESQTFMLTDTFEFEEGAQSKDVVLNFMSYESAVLKDNILKIGSIYRFEVSGFKDCIIEKIPITDKRLAIAWKHDISRIRFVSDGNPFTLRTSK